MFINLHKCHIPVLDDGLGYFFITYLHMYSCVSFNLLYPICLLCVNCILCDFCYIKPKMFLKITADLSSLIPKVVK